MKTNSHHISFSYYHASRQRSSSNLVIGRHLASVSIAVTDRISLTLFMFLLNALYFRQYFKIRLADSEFNSIQIRQKLFFFHLPYKGISVPVSLLMSSLTGAVWFLLMRLLWELNFLSVLVNHLWRWPGERCSTEHYIQWPWLYSPRDGVISAIKSALKTYLLFVTSANSNINKEM